MSAMFVVFVVTCLFVVAWPDRPTYPWDASTSGVSGRVSCFQGQGKGRAFPGVFLSFQKFREFRSTPVQRRSGLSCGCLWSWQSGRFLFRRGFQETVGLTRVLPLCRYMGDITKIVLNHLYSILTGKNRFLLKRISSLLNA